MENMRKFSIIWGMILIVIVTLLTVLGFVYKSKTKVYKELENKLVEAEKKYVDAKFFYPEINVLKTTSDELISEGYLDSLTINDEDCEGYVIVHKSTVFEYKGYISCDNYETKGYEK